jgi:transposase-like protein
LVRREYSAEEKERAVQAVAEAGGRIAVVARELGVPSATVGRWVRERNAADRVSAQGRERAVEAVAAANGRVAPVARELGVPSATVRQWVLEHNAADWAARVSIAFRYLKRCGFRFNGAEATIWEERATYRSDRSAVSVVKDYQGPRVEVELMRLVDGELPPIEVFIVESQPVNRFYVDELIRLRAPDGEAVVARLVNLPTFEDQLTFLAAALRRHGRDFLAGDLSVFDDLERIVRDEVREHPQQVSVFLPDTAGDAEQADAVALVRLVVPDEVAIVAGRYRTSRARGPGT